MHGVPQVQNSARGAELLTVWQCGATPASDSRHVATEFTRPEPKPPRFAYRIRGYAPRKRVCAYCLLSRIWQTLRVTQLLAHETMASG